MAALPHVSVITPDEGTFIIYLRTCLVTGKKYVGQTKRGLMVRWSDCICSARKGQRGCLYAAIRKYGADAWCHDVIAQVETQEAANKAERYWIRHHDCVRPKGYNIDAGGDVRNTHPETRRKLREQCTPKEWSDRNLRIAAAMTPEQRRAKSLKGAATQTPEERRRKALRAAASQTAEQRHQKALKRWAGTTPEQRRREALAREKRLPTNFRREAALKRWRNATPNQRAAQAETLRRGREIMATRRQPCAT